MRRRVLQAKAVMGEVGREEEVPDARLPNVWRDHRVPARYRALNSSSPVPEEAPGERGLHRLPPLDLGRTFCALHCFEHLSALRSRRYTVGSLGHLFLFGSEIPSTFRQKLADLSPDPYGDDDLESQ